MNPHGKTGFFTQSTSFERSQLCYLVALLSSVNVHIFSHLELTSVCKSMSVIDVFVIVERRAAWMSHSVTALESRWSSHGVVPN